MDSGVYVIFRDSYDSIQDRVEVVCFLPIEEVKAHVERMARDQGVSDGKWMMTTFLDDAVPYYKETHGFNAWTVGGPYPSVGEVSRMLVKGTG